MTDAVDRLSELLREAQASVTIDPGRNNTHPCTFCAAPAGPTHKLVRLGTYTNGGELVRPVCERCMPRAEIRATKSAVPGLPTLDGYRWEVDSQQLGDKRGLNIVLWRGQSRVGLIRWLWRTQRWQPRLPNDRAVLWSGDLLECGWSLLAACETGWSHNVEDHREKLADFISANGGAQ